MTAARTAQPTSPYRTKKIEDVQAGEWVWSCDPRTGKWSRGQVTRPLVHDYAGDLMTVAVGGERIEATGNHPFWVVAGDGLSQRPDPHDVPAAERNALGEAASGRWVEARSLQPGDLLLLRSGATATVEELYSRQVEQKVYNLEVAGLHTYAVGGDGVLVHNKAMQIAPIKRAPADETFYRTMTQAHYEQLLKTGKLPATAETFISPSKAFAANYNGVLVEFRLRPGVSRALQEVGVRDTSVLARRLFGDLPTVQKGWTSGNAFFKAEGTQINIGLGRGTALDIFNQHILEFAPVPK
jgi:hypothetical protein